MIQRICPCYNDGNPCKNRSVTCHSTCDAYIKWDEENKQIRVTVAKQRAVYDSINDVRVQAVTKFKKGFRHGKRT